MEAEKQSMTYNELISFFDAMFDLLVENANIMIDLSK
jgi:hypothetical protein